MRLSSVIPAAVLAVGLVACGDTTTDDDGSAVASVQTTVADVDAAPEPEPEPEPEPKDDSDGDNGSGDLSAQLAESIDINYGMTSWGPYITAVEIRNGNAFIRTVLTQQDEDTAELVQRGIINLVRTSDDYKDEIRFVVIEDAGGVVITQEMV